MSKKQPRFPGIDWYCDHCGDLLNNQKGFDDHKYIWQCRKCGYKNSISVANISPATSPFTKKLYQLFGFIDGTLMYTITMLLITCAFRRELIGRVTHFIGYLLLSLVFMTIISVLFEYRLYHRKKDIKTFFYLFFRDLKEDIIEPLATIFNFVTLPITMMIEHSIEKEHHFTRTPISTYKGLIFNGSYWLLLVVVEILIFCFITQWNFLK